MGFGIVIIGIAAIVRGIFGDSYTMVFACSILFAVGQPFILNSVGIVPGKWFPARERATANGLGLMSSYVGMMIGLLVTPVLLESGVTIKNILIVYGVWSVIVAILFVALTRENPPTPPCAEEESQRESFVAGLKILIKRPSFIFIFLGFFIVFGVFNTFFTLIEPILVHFSNGAVDPVQIGILGVIILIMGIVGSVIIPLISDKSKGHKRKPILLICHIIGTAGFAAFLFTTGFVGMAIAAVIYGLFVVGVSPVTMTFSAEVSYPVSEGTSEGLLMFAGNVSGVILLGVATLFGGNYNAMMIMLSVIMVIAWILFMAAKETKLLGK